jgi:uncharacterized membrane protein
MEIPTNASPHSRRLGRWIAVFTGIVIGAYLALTPSGIAPKAGEVAFPRSLIGLVDWVLTKADMAGYAVCHRIPSHSFFFCKRQLPLCARCSGTFVGALTALFGQAVVLRRCRDSELPSVWIILVLVGFIGLMGVDGLNSYMSMIPGAPYVYEPMQWLRVVTGSLTGLAIGSLIYPIFNLSLWKRPAATRAIRSFRDLGILIALEAVLVALVLSGWSFLLIPLALLSAMGVLTMLTLINSVLVMMVFQWENQYERFWDAAQPLMLGFCLALIQIGVIDLVRYVFTGTLVGMPGLS